MWDLDGPERRRYLNTTTTTTTRTRSTATTIPTTSPTSKTRHTQPSAAIFTTALSDSDEVYSKTRMMGLSEGRKSFPIGLAVLIQYRSVTASQPATQPPSHVAVAITLNALAKASSLKTSVRPMTELSPFICHKHAKSQLVHWRKVRRV